MTGLIYKSQSSGTKLRDLIKHLQQNKTEKITIIECESFLRFLFLGIFSRAKFIHLFNPKKIEVRVGKLMRALFKRKLIFSFETENDYKKVARLIKNEIILVESESALNFFKNNSKYSTEIAFIRPYADSAVFVASGAQQLSLKKEILFLHDSSDNSKAHLVVEMLKYLPPEIFLTCLDDCLNEENAEYLKDIAKNLKVASRVKIESSANYDLYQNAKDLFLVAFAEKDTSRFDFSCLALSQGLLVLSNTSSNQEDINGWFRLESIAPKALSKKILELCDDFIEVDSKKALSFISKEAKAEKLLDFYIEL
jgi:hypothetical protein